MPRRPSARRPAQKKPAQATVKFGAKGDLVRMSARKVGTAKREGLRLYEDGSLAERTKGAPGSRRSPVAMARNKGQRGAQMRNRVAPAKQAAPARPPKPAKIRR